jgi:hypothetical protein
MRGRAKVDNDVRDMVIFMSGQEARANSDDGHRAEGPEDA